jgi:hypothetical protein
VKKLDKRETVVFVKLDEYKDITDIMSLIKSKIKQAKYVLNRIAELKKHEDSEIEEWSSEIDNIEERVESIDRTLTEPEV